MFIAAISLDLIRTDFIQNKNAAIKATKTSVSKLQSHKEIVEFFFSKIEFVFPLEQFFCRIHALSVD